MSLRIIFWGPEVAVQCQLTNEQAACGALTLVSHNVLKISVKPIYDNMGLYF